MSRINLALVTLAFCISITGCTKDYIENKVPVADAGSSKTITLPDSVVLTGTGSDDDGKVVAYLWSQISGPAASSIINPGSASTTVKFNTKGTYVFQLMVTDDKGATGVDTVSVIVNPGTVKTLTLQPASNSNEFMLGLYQGNNQSGGSRVDLPICAWTVNSDPIKIRVLTKFDLSTIPANATIVSANLYLYSYPYPALNGNLKDANFGSDNTLLVQQVLSSWSPGSVTWFNQPSSSTTNQVVVPHTNQSVLDLNLDVSSMVSSMVNTNSNYGFMLKLQNETIYTSRIFVGSYNTTYTTKYPKLVVAYQ